MQALCARLQEGLTKLQEAHTSSEGMSLLRGTILEQRACLQRFTEADDPMPLLHIMESVRTQQLRFSSHAITLQHANALVRVHAQRASSACTVQMFGVFPAL